MQQDIQIDFLSGGGELGELIRGFDWSKTSLGPLEDWSLTIITTLGIVLSSPVPMITLWGDEGLMIYNDAYAQFAGGRHPGLLGQEVRAGWPEVSGFNDRVMKMVLAGGVLSYREQEMQLNRSGQPETVWLNLDYSPVYNEHGTPVGVLAVVVDATGRVLAERDLKAEEAAREAERQRQRRLFEEAPGFILILRGPDHVVEFVNRTHQRLFGSADWVGKPLQDVVPGEDFSVLDEVLASGRFTTVQGSEVGNRTDYSAGPLYISYMCAPLYNDAGEITGLFCEGFDVTETEGLRRRQAALSELVAKISEIEDANVLAQEASKIAARTLRANRAGYGRINEAAGRIDMLPDWTAPGVPSLEGPLAFESFGPALGYLRQGETFVVEDTETDPRRRSEARDMLESLKIRAILAVPIFEQGRMVAMVAATDDRPRQWTADEVDFARQVVERTRDGIERRRAETKLRQNEATLRFLDRLGLAVAPLSSASEILSTITRMLGEHLGVANCAYADVDEDADDIFIRNEWMAPEGPDLSIVGRYRLVQFGPTCGQALRSGTPFVINNVDRDLPVEERKPFQSMRLGALVTLPLVKDERLTALMAVHEVVPRDWTDDEVALVREAAERAWAHVQRARADGERRDAERRLRAALEAKVIERNAALLQARKMEAVGRLTGGMAHDFNNLLTAVLGNLEMLQRWVPAERRVQSLIENATEAAKRGAALTLRMQAFSGRQSSGNGPMTIKDTIAGIGELIARTLGPMLTIKTEIEPALPQVVADLQELEAALIDLLLQARDATGGLGQIGLDARYAEDAPAELALKSRKLCLPVGHSFDARRRGGGKTGRGRKPDDGHRICRRCGWGVADDRGAPGQRPCRALAAGGPPAACRLELPNLRRICRCACA